MRTSFKLIAISILFLTASIAVAQQPPLAPGVEDLLAATSGQAKISVDSQTGLARFVQLPSESLSLPAALNKATAPQDRAMSFLRAYGSAFGMTDADSELRAAGTIQDSRGN